MYPVCLCVDCCSCWRQLPAVWITFYFACVYLLFRAFFHHIFVSGPPLPPALFLVCLWPANKKQNTFYFSSSSFVI
jgi:hypothetical protein